MEGMVGQDERDPRGRDRQGGTREVRRSPTSSLLALCLLVPGCCWLGSYHTPEGITQWQDTSPPKLSLREKAAAYQERLETRHLTPEGLLKYSIQRGQGDGSYGDLSDGPFHTGIYLASQALRYASTREPEAKKQVLLALNGLRL